MLQKLSQKKYYKCKGCFALLLLFTYDLRNNSDIKSSFNPSTLAIEIAPFQVNMIVTAHQAIYCYYKM